MPPTSVGRDALVVGHQRLVGLVDDVQSSAEALAHRGRHRRDEPEHQANELHRRTVRHALATTNSASKAAPTVASGSRKTIATDSTVRGTGTSQSPLRLTAAGTVDVVSEGTWKLLA